MSQDSKELELKASRLLARLLKQARTLEEDFVKLLASTKDADEETKRHRFEDFISDVEAFLGPNDTK